MMFGRRAKNDETDDDGYEVTNLNLSAPASKRQTRNRTGPPSPKRSPKPNVGKRSSAPTASPGPRSPKPKVAGTPGKRSSAPSNVGAASRSPGKSPKPQVRGKSPNMKSSKRVAMGVNSPRPKGAVVKHKQSPRESPMSPSEVAESMRNIKRTAVPASIPLPFDVDDSSQTSNEKAVKRNISSHGLRQNGYGRDITNTQKPAYIPANLDWNSRGPREEKENEKLSMSDHVPRRQGLAHMPGYIPSSLDPPDRSNRDKQILAQSEHGTSNSSSFRHRARGAKERAARARANQSQQPQSKQSGKTVAIGSEFITATPKVAKGTSVDEKKKVAGKGGNAIGAVAMVGDDLFDSDSSDGEGSFDNVRSPDRFAPQEPIRIPEAELAPNYEDVVKEALRKQTQRAQYPPTMVMAEVVAESAIPIEEPKRICGVKSVYCFILLVVVLTAALAGGLGFGITKKKIGDPEIEYVFIPWPTSSPTEAVRTSLPSLTNFITQEPTISPTEASDLPTSTPTTEAFGYYWKLFRPYSTIGIFQPGSPQYRAVEFVTDNVWIRDETPFEVLLERFVLGVIYYSTVGEKWTEDSGKWLIPTDICSSWPGVECDDDNFVSEISLDDGVGLAGTVPIEVGELTALKSLRLTGGEVGGTLARQIFSSIDNLSDLVLSRNKLSGAIPSEIGLLTKLTQLVLDSNRFTGSIPTEIGLLTGLKRLDLSKNKFEGEIPSEIGLLTNLVSLNFDQNKIQGMIPSEVGLLTSINWLNWNSNKLTKTIPSEIGNLKNLAVLHLSDNFLSGSVPSELLPIIPKMRFLHLERNYLVDDFKNSLCLETELPKIWADCLGDEPEILCDCCTSCCNDEQNGCVNYEEPVSSGLSFQYFDIHRRNACWLMLATTAAVLLSTALLL